MGFFSHLVLQGPPLAENLRSQLEGQPLVPHIPQSTNLALITAGDKYCVGVKGRWLGAKGAWLWNWKDHIDRKFMDKYSTDLDFTKMMSAMVSPASLALMNPLSSYTTPDQLALLSAAKMRCGGCGGKVGASVLSRVLQRLQADQQTAGSEESKGTSEGGIDVVVGLNAPDDAAVLAPPPPGHMTVHTVDFFRAPMQDPFVFGSIAAAHALSDCHAMGAKPVAALAIAVVPFAAADKVESDLYQLMAGALKTLSSEGCQLVGGHTSEGSELALGFSVYGTVSADALLTKGALQPGQALILTKPLGQGVVMAAAMHGMGKGRYVTAAQVNMQQSNGPAARILLRHGASACTDVTGFGLLGHLAEMCKAEGMAVEVEAKALPLVEGSLECVATGKLSSLHQENSKVAAVVSNADKVVAHPLWPVLVDPQTGE